MVHVCFVDDGMGNCVYSFCIRTTFGRSPAGGDFWRNARGQHFHGSGLSIEWIR